MRIKRTIITLMGLCFLVSGSYGEVHAASGAMGVDENNIVGQTPVTGQNQAISIADLQAAALSRNPAIAVLEQKIEAARGMAIQAGLPYNPTIGYDSEDIGVAGKAGKHGVVLSQEFMTGNKRGYAQNAGNLEVEVLIRQRDSLSQGVANEVRALAWRVLAARELVAVRNWLKQLADTTEKQAKEFRRIGEISEMNLLQLSVQAQESGLAVLTAQNRQIAAERELSALLGPEFQTIGPLSDSLANLLDLNEMNEESFLNNIIANSPQIKEAQAAAQQKQAIIALEQSRAKSNVTVGGGVYYDAGDERSIAAANVSMPIRLYDQNQGNILRAQAEYNAAVRQVEQIELQLRQQCAQIYQTYKTARQESLIYRDSVLPNLKKSYEMNFQAFKQAQIGFLEMSNSQIAYFEASAKFIESQYRLAEAITLLEGMLLNSGRSMNIL